MRENRQVSLRLKLLASFTLISLAAFLVVGYLVTTADIRSMENQIADDLRSTLVGAAMGVDGDSLQTLYQAYSNLPPCAGGEFAQNQAAFYPDDPRYWEHVNQLEAVHTIEPRALLYTYVRGERPNEMIFLGSNMATWDPPAGASFCYHFIATGDAEPAYRGMEETTLLLTRYTDEFGEWVSGYTPIRNAQGEVVAGLGVDFSAQIIREMRREIWNRLLLSFGGAYIVVSVGVFFATGIVVRPIRTLTAAAQRISVGDYDIDLSGLHQQRYIDEMGLIARVFEMMASKRQKAEERALEQRTIAETLAHTAELLTSTLNPDEVLELILEEVGHVVQNDGSAVLTIREGRFKVAGLRNIGFLEDFNERYPDGVSIVPESYLLSMSETKEPQPIASVDIRLLTAWGEKLGRDVFWIKSWLAAPIMREDAVVGAIALVSKQPDFYSEEDTARLRVFANQASIAINNAMLTRELTAQRQELQHLSNRLLAAQESERQHIARELHDAMGQALTAIQINLATLTYELPPLVPEALKERLLESREFADQALTQVREMILDLRPTMLDDLGLVPTLHWYVNRYARRTQIEVTVDVQDEARRLDTATETALYRVVQEALTNVAKHARARHIQITLRHADGPVRLRITDDGQGFEPDGLVLNTGLTGMGLLGMQERVKALGGTISIQSTPGEGTTITVEIPLVQTDAVDGDESGSVAS